MIRWDTPEQVLHARAVVRELERAERHLAAAEIATRDQSVANTIHLSKRPLLVALRRARAILKDEDLKAAEQPGFDL